MAKNAAEGFDNPYLAAGINISDASFDAWAADNIVPMDDYREKVVSALTLNNAVLVGDFNAPDVVDFLGTEVEYIWAMSQKTPGGKKKGGRQKSSGWQHGQETLASFLNQTSRHVESVEKDGLAFIYNRGKPFPRGLTVDGAKVPLVYRTKETAQAITAFYADVDGGDTVERVVEMLRQRRLMSMVYTTHSHTTKGAPGSDRFRIIVFLEQPYELPESGQERADALRLWERKYAGFCDELRLGEIDACGLKLAQIMFAPRRPVGADFKHYIIAGTGLRIDDMPEAEPEKYVNKVDAREWTLTASAVEHDGEPAVLSDGFNVRDWFNDVGGYCFIGSVLDMLDWDTRTGADDEREIMCPNDAAHSNPGDPEDTACWMMEDDGGDGFRISCLHDHCRGVHTWDMVCLIEKNIEDGVVALMDGYESLSDLLCDPNLYPDEIDGEPVEISKYDYGVERVVEIKSISSKGALKRHYKKLENPLNDDLAGLFAGIERAGGNKDAVACLNELLEDAGYNGNDRTSLKARGSQLLKEHKAAYAAKKREEEREDSASSSVAVVNQWDFDTLHEYGARRIHETNAEKPGIFHYMERLYMIREDSNGKARMKEVGKGTFENHLNTVARFAKVTGENKDSIGVAAPDEVVRYLFNDDYSAYPPLRGMVVTPIFTQSGALLIQPGYDWSSQLYYRPDALLSVPDVPEIPTSEDVREAKRLLIEEVLADFPIGGKDRAGLVAALDDEGASVPDLTNLIAFILQQFMREMIDGPTPGFLLNKPAAGTGASKLTDTLSILATGRVTPAVAMPPNRDEAAKTLTSVLANGQQIVFFDNINHNVDSGELASAMTTPTYQARILGKSQTIETEVRCSWVFTGNGMSLSQELRRRMVLIGLDRGVPDPENFKGDWRHDSIEAWVGENRGELVWACLTLIQNWVAQGMVHQKDVVLASYENWSGAVGGVLKAAGLDGFMGNKDDLKSMVDDAGSAFGDLMEELADYPDGTPFTAALDEGKSYKGYKVLSLRDILLHKEIVISDWRERGDQNYTDKHLITRGFTADAMTTGGGRKRYRTEKGTIWFEAKKLAWGKTFIMHKE